MTIANTIISQDNASLKTMGTDQLLDLFSLDDKAKGQEIVSSGGSSSDQNKRESIKSILENLGDLWDEKEYESEYNLDNFIKSLKRWSDGQNPVCQVLVYAILFEYTMMLFNADCSWLSLRVCKLGNEEK